MSKAGQWCQAVLQSDGPERAQLMSGIRYVLEGAPKAPTAPAPVAPELIARVTVSGPRKTTYRQKAKTSHGFHLIATVLTCGLWAPVWAFVGTANAIHPGRKVTERHHY